MAQDLTQALCALENVELIVFDFDGVMTDNTVYLSESGEEMVRCHRGDGWGVRILREASVAMMVLSTEVNAVVRARASKLRIPAFVGCENKEKFLAGFLKQKAIAPERVIYLGNDENDAGCLRLVGLPLLVADAHPSVIPLATVMLETRGGQGAVRELAHAMMSLIAGGRLRVTATSL
jgi:YrbI family 3-deoxy-D-manno-octulosonate 8-phosphate phosphatase